MSVIIGADIVPSANNCSLFASSDIDLLVGGELQNVLRSAKYRIFNLEIPLVDAPSPINKCGPVLRADCNTVNAMKKLNVNLFTLANNHIMDQGREGLESTIKTIESKNISFLGAGNDLKHAAKPFIFDWNNKKVGVYSCAEHEFSIASENSPGANPFDALESFDHVYALKSQCDFVIVLYHGGKEYYQYPSPMLQRVCRKFVEKGSNLVVCQHSHCIGCEEKYLNGTIVYGQGNFLFDSCKNTLAHTSLLVKLNDDFTIKYIPLVKVEKGVRLAEGKKADEILSGFRKRSEQILEDGFVANEYNKFATTKLNSYMLHCSGYYHKFLPRLINKIIGYRLSNYFGIGMYKIKDLISLRNFIECEAHRELWLAGLYKGKR